MLALGGEGNNVFCLLRDGQAILTHPPRDLEDAVTGAQNRAHLRLAGELSDHAPDVLVVDSHPDYLSARLGRDRASAAGLELHDVQHHHAHIAACLAENGRSLNAEPVLGVALDGLGFGADGSLWGGEFLRADYRGCTRLAALAPVPLPGGSRAVHEPWRNAYAQIHRALGWRLYRAAFPQLGLTRFLEGRPLATLDDMLANGLNSPPASSCGRLFDAVAAAVGLCRESVSREDQAVFALEAAVDETALRTDTGYPFDFLPQVDGPPRLESAPMWRALLADLSRGVSLGATAARFHRGLAQAIGRTIRRVHRDEGAAPFDTVALSGGVFENRILLQQVLEEIAPTGLRVLTHSRLPADDRGLSLGQAAIAAARIMQPQAPHPQPVPSTR